MIDLAELRPLVEVMAAERTTDAPEKFDDAVQEGLIAAWKASRQSPDKPGAYYRSAARNGVTDVVRGRSFTGHLSSQGRQDAHGFADPLVTDERDARDLPDTYAGRELSAAVIRAEVHNALELLDPADRELVRLRYWHDLGFADCATRLNRPAGTLSRRWVEIIRPALREWLAPLEGSY